MSTMCVWRTGQLAMVNLFSPMLCFEDPTQSVGTFTSGWPLLVSIFLRFLTFSIPKINLLGVNPFVK